MLPNYDKVTAFQVGSNLSQGQLSGRVLLAHRPQCAVRQWSAPEQLWTQEASNRANVTRSNGSKRNSKSTSSSSSGLIGTLTLRRVFGRRRKMLVLTLPPVLILVPTIGRIPSQVLFLMQKSSDFQTSTSINARTTTGDNYKRS